MAPERTTKPSAPSDNIGTPARTPLEMAQEVCWDAWESGSPKQRIKLARKALQLSLDCADAYVILANEARSLKVATKLYAKGVEAGERGLGPGVFKREVGCFWSASGTRPYMRARFGLARSLWRLGQHKEAITECSEMLRLNPNDNQGVRYMLVCYLLDVGRDGDAVDILHYYEGDGTADWNYTWVLITFRKEGDTKSTRDLLWAAVRSNYHVPGFLLGKRSLPVIVPDEFCIGHESEAICYADTCAGLWTKTPGALDWLAGQVRWH